MEYGNFHDACSPQTLDASEMDIRYANQLLCVIPQTQTNHGPTTTLYQPVPSFHYGVALNIEPLRRSTNMPGRMNGYLQHHAHHPNVNIERRVVGNFSTTTNPKNITQCASSSTTSSPPFRRDTNNNDDDTRVSMVAQNVSSKRAVGSQRDRDQRTFSHSQRSSTKHIMSQCFGTPTTSTYQQYSNAIIKQQQLRKQAPITIPIPTPSLITKNHDHNSTPDRITSSSSSTTPTTSNSTNTNTSNINNNSNSNTTTNNNNTNNSNTYTYNINNNHNMHNHISNNDNYYRNNFNNNTNSNNMCNISTNNNNHTEYDYYNNNKHNNNINIVNNIGYERVSTMQQPTRPQISSQPPTSHITLTSNHQPLMTMATTAKATTTMTTTTMAITPSPSPTPTQQDDTSLTIEIALEFLTQLYMNVKKFHDVWPSTQKELKQSILQFQKSVNYHVNGEDLVVEILCRGFVSLRGQTKRLVWKADQVRQATKNIRAGLQRSQTPTAANPRLGIMSVPSKHDVASSLKIFLEERRGYINAGEMNTFYSLYPNAKACMTKGLRSFIQEFPELLRWGTSLSRTGDGIICLKEIDPRTLVIGESSRGTLHSPLQSFQKNAKPILVHHTKPQTQTHPQPQTQTWVPWKIL